MIILKIKHLPHPTLGEAGAPEAQEILEKYTGYGSAFVPGTRTHKFVQGKKVLYMTGEQAAAVDRLATEYGKILGFGK